jgi:fructose-specific phosphotransferase system IIC component
MQFTTLGLIAGILAGLVVTVILTVVWPKDKARVLRPLVTPIAGVAVALLAMYFIK